MADTLADKSNSPTAVATGVLGVTKTPGVCGGVACLAQTRMPVWTLVDARRSGYTDDDLRAAYPFLTEQQFAAAFEYAAAHPSEIDREIAENAAA